MQNKHTTPTDKSQRTQTHTGAPKTETQDLGKPKEKKTEVEHNQGTAHQEAQN